MNITLARFGELDNPLIGCSMGFLQLSGLERSEVLGRNCRFLNVGLTMPIRTRERLHHTMRTGAPFLGLLENRRHLGNGCSEVFQNMLYTVVVVAGARSYILGIQVDVTGLNLDLAHGSHDAAWVQTMFDSVLAAGTESWIHVQEGEYHAAPLYVCISLTGNTSEEQVEIVEDRLQLLQDQCLVLAPQFSPLALPDVDAVTKSRKSPSRHQDYSSQSTASSADSEQASLDNDLVGTPIIITQLPSLFLEDPTTIIIARGVSKLGPNLADTLCSYFGFYGLVKAVHIPYASKTTGYKNRKRAGGGGREARTPARCFIVMSTADERTKIIEQAEHVVQNVKIVLEPFTIADGSQNGHFDKSQQIPDKFPVSAPHLSHLALHRVPSPHWSLCSDDEPDGEELRASYKCPQKFSSGASTAATEQDFGRTLSTTDTEEDFNPHKWTAPSSTRHQRDSSQAMPVPWAITEQSGNVKGFSPPSSEHDVPIIPRQSPQNDQLFPEAKHTFAPTMKTQLKALDATDPATVLVVRGVSSLGVNLTETMCDYFSSYGVVEAVHIPYTLKKCGYKGRRRSRQVNRDEGVGLETRAPGRCFVVMSTADARDEILASSAEHLVQNVKVSLEAFVRGVPAPVHLDTSCTEA